METFSADFWLENSRNFGCLFKLKVNKNRLEFQIKRKSLKYKDLNLQIEYSRDVENQNIESTLEE